MMVQKKKHEISLRRTNVKTLLKTFFFIRDLNNIGFTVKAKVTSTKIKWNKKLVDIQIKMSPKNDVSLKCLELLS